MEEAGKQCLEIQDVLVDRALGELDVGRAAGVDKHLAVCAECRSRAVEVEAALELLRRAPSIDVSPGFEAALRARLHAERRRERAARTTVVVVLAAAVRRVREFQLGTAVYPLIAIGMAYVFWAMVTRESGYRPRAYPDGPAGVLVFYPPRGEGAGDPVIKLAEIQKAAELKFANATSLDVFEPVWPDLEPVQSLPSELVIEPGEHPPAELVQPKTAEEFALIPDATLPRRAVLPSGGPGGSALALARFTTIKNSKAHLRMAVSKALLWLCANQSAAGSWSAGGGSPYSDTEVTAAAVLAFMESGFAPSGRSDGSRRVRLALSWLIRQKRPDGMLAPPGARQDHAQAMVCTALSEALRLSDSVLARRRFHPVIQEAVAALLRRQSASGAWGGDDAELTALVVIATSSARAAGLAVDATGYRSALAWLESYRKRFPADTYASVDTAAVASKSVSYAAVGQILASPEVSWSGERALQATRELIRAPVIWQSGDFFRWYAATLTAYRLDGRFWRWWQDALVLQLVPNQEGFRGKKPPANAGSWEPHGFCADGGRAYATAMAVLSLTASCGHAPVYGSTK